MDDHPFAPDRLRIRNRQALPALTWFQDISPCLDTADFVPGLLVEGSAAVVYGESNTGKTFWTLDLALHVASGLEWCGRRVEAGGVVYCVLEGSARFRNRVTAWRTKRGLDGQDIPFAALESPMNLLDPRGDTDSLIQLIQAAAETIDVPVKLIVIDTLSRALAGGNENAPTTWEPWSQIWTASAKRPVPAFCSFTTAVKTKPAVLAVTRCCALPLIPKLRSATAMA